MTNQTSPAQDAPSTDRQATVPWLLVMRREILAKVTDKGFLISTVVTASLIAAYLGFIAWDAQRGDAVSIAVTQTDRPMAEAVAAAAESEDEGVTVTVREAGSPDAAEALVDTEKADAWLHPGAKGWVLTYRSENDPDLTRLVETVVASTVLEQNARAAGTDLSTLQRGTSVDTALLEGNQEKADLARVVGFAFAFLFYLASILFGMQLASSVVEEKQSRIVEIIAASIPLRHLMIGKILGNTVLAMAQVLLYAAVGLVGLSFTQFSTLVPSLSGPVAWFLVFFAAGFVALSCLWAVAGAMASRNEDLQSTTTPLTMTLVFVFIAALSVDGSTERVLSFVPPFSAILMPQRLLSDDPALWEPVAALVLLLAAAGVLVLVGERLYRRALMQTNGKVSLKQAWRAEV